MNKHINLQHIILEVNDLTRAVGGYIRNELGNLKRTDVETKGVHDFVTYVDKTSEQKLIAELGRILPGSGFLAEESPERKSKNRFNWIIDPLDGTTNFIHGLPLFCISIALQDQNHTILGVVYEINLNECFYAYIGGPAMLNGSEIQVSKKKTLDESLLATGFPYYDYSKLEAYMQVFVHLLKNSHGIRRLGSAAADLVYVACGRFEGFYEYGLHPWDVAGGAFILQQAGGQVSDFAGGDDFIFGGEIIATNGFIQEELLSVIKNNFAR